MRGWIPTKTNQTRSGGLNSFIFKTIFEMHSLTLCVSLPSVVCLVSRAKQRFETKHHRFKTGTTTTNTEQRRRWQRRCDSLPLAWLAGGFSHEWWYAEPSPAVTMASILRF